jgi:hypothetical protein
MSTNLLMKLWETQFNPVTGEARANVLICATQNTPARHIPVKPAPQNHGE